MVAWWPGDGMALDVVGTNHGTLQNAVTFAPGEVGQAFGFDGVSSYVALPNNLFPFPTSGSGGQAFSFELWFKTTTGGVLLGQEFSSSEYVPAIYVGSDGKLRAQMFWNGSINPIASGQTVSDGIFHHSAVTYDGNNMTLYLDGAAIASRAQTQLSYASVYYYQLGAGYTSGWPAGNSGVSWFSGLIDEVSLYNRALSSGEIAAIYSAGSAGKCFSNNPAPIFVQSPMDQTGYVYTAVTFTGAAMGSPRPDYQWLSNGVPILGATNTALVLSNLWYSYQGAYALVANNMFESITSAVAHLSVTNTVETGLVAYYRFDGNTTDSTAHGLDGTINNAGFSAGRCDQGLLSSGAVDSFVEVQPNDLLNPTNAVSISLWVRARSFPNKYCCMVYKPAATPDTTFADRAYTMWVTSDGGIHLTSTAEGGQMQTICDSPAGGIQLNQFTHVVGVVDSTAHLMKVFIDGNLVASAPYPGSSIRTGSFPLRMGGPFPTFSDQAGLDGILDEVRIYSRALSDAEAVELFALGCPQSSSSIGVFNTGVNDNNALLSPGSIDPHYSIIASADANAPGTNANILDSAYVNATAETVDHVTNAWMNNGPNSEWIGPMTSELGSSAPGIYIYRTTFDLSGFDSSSARLSGAWSTDDYGLNIYVNGNPTGISRGPASGLPQQWETFELTNGFVTGLNTIDFVVSNSVWASYNPTGLRVELSGSARVSTSSGLQIINQPTNQFVQAGATAMFTVGAEGQPPLAYQWEFDGNLIAGASGASLSITNVQMTTAGDYSVIVSNASGSVTSAAAQLAILGDGANGNQPVQISASGLVVQEPGKTNLVIITHGWIPQFDPVVTTPIMPSWVTNMAQVIQANVPNDWEVVALDWALDAWTVSPDSALDAGRIKGTLVGNRLAGQSWRHIHFVSHSAGSALIQAATDVIRTNAPSKVLHTTFLDPFLGFDYRGLAWFGTNSDWADNYFAQDWTDRPLGLFGALTDGPLTNAFNVDVSWVDPNKYIVTNYCYTPAPSGLSGGGSIPCGEQALSSHDYPHDFYFASVLNTNPACAMNYGFAMSKEGGGWDNRGNYQAGHESLPLCGQQTVTQNLVPMYIGQQLQLDLLPNAMSGSGAALSGGTGFTLTSDAPAWFALGLTVTDRVNFVQFDAGFSDTNAAEGLMTVYWNTNRVGMVDERVDSSGFRTYRFPLPTIVTGGLYSLSFRLDSFTSMSSSIVVTNVATGFVGVKQPIMLGIWLGTNSGPILQLTAARGFNYFVLSSTNLAQWTPAALLANTNGTTFFADPTPTDSNARFYRAVLP